MEESVLRSLVWEQRALVYATLKMIDVDYFLPAVVPRATLDIEMPQTICLKAGKTSAHDHLEK